MPTNPGEVHRLRTAVRDLVALSTIPAAWVGREPAAIATGLADVLVGSLHLDFAFVRLCDPKGGPAVEVARGKAWSAFPTWLQRHVAAVGPVFRQQIIPDIGGGVARSCGVVIPIGVNGEAGLVAAASDRTDFPDEIDQMLLSVAGNHAATAFQSARLIEERRRTEHALSQAHSELEGKVAERTAELWRTTAELETILSASPVGIALFGQDQTVQRCNPAFERLLGATQEAILGRPVPVPAVHREKWQALARGLNRGKAFANVELRLLRNDGSEFDATVSCAPLQDETGSPAGFVGTIEDITALKRAEAERQAHLWLLESMDRINRAIQGTSDVEQMTSRVLELVLSIFDCDRAWLVYPCDPEARSWRVPMEQTRDQFPGAFVLGSEVPMDADVANVFQTVRACDGPVRFGPGSDHALPADVAQRLSIQSQIAMAVYPKGEKPYLFALHQCSYPRLWTPQEERLVHEIGRRLADALTTRLMLRHLRDSEAKLEQAERIAHVGYWDRDLDSDRISWSDETYRIFGLAPQEHPMTFGAVRDLIHPDDRPVVIGIMTNALHGSPLHDGPRYEMEYRVVRPSGEVRMVHVYGDVTRDNAGRPRRVFGTVQDITERKRAETALQEAQAKLAHVSRVTTLGELVASIAHEINQPLAAILADANASLNWLATASPDLEMVRDALRAIGEDGRRAADVIQRIRQLATRTEPPKAWLDVNDVIHDVVRLVRAELRAHAVSLQMELAPDLPPVRGDRVQLQQVIINLLMNGIEAMASVTDRPRALVIRSRAHDDGQLVVAVQDTGVGIDPSTVDQLFNAFFTTKPGGMGMGLSISRSIVEGHAGRLWATANPGHGATFQFALPILP